MKSQSRAVAFLLTVGIVIVAVAWLAPRLFAKEGIEGFAPVPTASAPLNAISPSAGPNVPRLLQNPALSRTQIAFNFAGEIWTVPREGGTAQRLVSGQLMNARQYGTKGEWEVENVGIAPDVELEQDPMLMRAGHDPQLERAVQLAMEALVKSPPAKLVRPAYPNYGPRLPKL
jgi:tricorn protease